MYCVTRCTSNVQIFSNILKKKTPLKYLAREGKVQTIDIFTEAPRVAQHSLQST